MNLFGGNAFAQEILVAILRWGEEQVCQAIGDDAVHFLGHGAVKGAQAGFDVRDRHEQLGAYQSGSDR